MSYIFQKATKRKLKLRLAIDGPSGSGKTYTALEAATAIANGGRIAVIDTERGSASLYSDKFNFDVLELETFSPQIYIDAIHAAEEEGYEVIIVDSLSHAWEGEGGALDMVDQATTRNRGNAFLAWKEVTPIQRKLVDTLLRSPSHMIVTMRSKMDYVQEKDNQGKTVIRKVGMAPVQRQGIEYEFTIVGDMDLDHNMVISKSRCDLVADKIIKKPDGKFFKKIVDWLNSGEDPLPRPVITPESISSDAPSDKAWSAWFDLVDQAANLGIEVPELSTSITTPELRSLYAELKSQVRRYESTDVNEG
ncbi:MAG: ATP-binding protein [Omnitrophica WOR_2 bacterium]